MNLEALREAEDLINQAPEIPEVTKKQISEKLKQARSPLETDKWIYRSVVWALGLAILICVAFSFCLMWRHMGTNVQGDIKLPEIFMAIGSAAVGALAGLLAPSPVNRSPTS